jgi:hypothetical protein
MAASPAASSRRNNPSPTLRWAYKKLEGEDAEAQRDTRHGALELKQLGWASLRWDDANISARIYFRLPGPPPRGRENDVAKGDGEPWLPIPSPTRYSRVMSSGDFTSILRLSGLSALALGLLLLRPAR